MDEKPNGCSICLRGFYSKGQLADLFSPILGVEQVKEKVIGLILMESVRLCGLERVATTFKRKFHKAFGTTAIG